MWFTPIIYDWLFGRIARDQMGEEKEDAVEKSQVEARLTLKQEYIKEEGRRSF